MFFIVITFNASTLLKSTLFKEEHSSKNDSISVTNDKSNLVKSIIVISTKFLNMELQEAKLLPNIIFIVFVPETKFSTLFIPDVIGASSLIWILAMKET